MSVPSADIMIFGIEVLTNIGIGILILCGVSLVVYLSFLPTIIAFKRRHRLKEVILILNILGMIFPRKSGHNEELVLV